MAISGENSIFKKIGKRILDPYAGKEVLEIRRKDNDEVKMQEQVRVITMAQGTLKPTRESILTKEESSPLDDLVEGFHRDLQIQDPVEIIRVRTVPKAEKVSNAPKVKKPAARKLTRHEQLLVRREARENAWRDREGALAGPVVGVVNDGEPDVVDEEPTGAEWTQEQFWNWIAGLGWGDRSDNPHVRTAESTIRRMSPSQKQRMMAMYERLYTALAENLNNFLKGYDMGEENRRAILSHIIARGENFYNAICADPDFASYLISDASRPAEQNEFINFSLLIF